MALWLLNLPVEALDGGEAAERSYGFAVDKADAPMYPTPVVGDEVVTVPAGAEPCRCWVVTAVDDVDEPERDADGWYWKRWITYDVAVLARPVPGVEFTYHAMQAGWLHGGRFVRGGSSQLSADQADEVSEFLEAAWPPAVTV